MLLNLLGNAVKFTERDGTVTFQVSVLETDIETPETLQSLDRQSAVSLRFEVQDTGVGLSEEDCQRVFEKFYRVKANKNMAPGTGLGLPLAKHIVEEVHGGELQVHSTLGAGSTFSATLPGVGNTES